METTENIGFLETLLPMAVVVFLIAAGVVFLTQQFHKNLYKQKLKEEELKNLHHLDLLRSSIQVQEEERKRIAQDIHDELGATLSISKMLLQQVEEQEKNNTGSLLPALQNIRSLTESSLLSMRRISHQLMPQQLETFGLVKTLEAVAAQANKTGTIKVCIIDSDTTEELSWPVKLGLYRINMELMNNSLKHAEANSIIIELDFTDNYISCTYTDNGKGMKDETVRHGLGLTSIEGRAKSLGGTITYDKNCNGFKAVIKIPVII
jgi:signal transduction histidine kinase